MNISGIRGILCLLRVSVFWMTSYAIRVHRHYTMSTSSVLNTYNKPGHTVTSLIVCSAVCGSHCDCFGFNSLTKKCRTYTTCTPEDMTGYELGWRYYSPESPEDCQEVFERGDTTSGVYDIRLLGEWRLIPVYCDMATATGGWTVIQNRVDGIVNFNRSWEEFKTGFGDLYASHWIGNAFIHQFTKTSSASLYVSITDVNGRSQYIEYENFSILGEDQQYRLNITGKNSGSLDDRIRYANAHSSIINGMGFTTFDQDNDHYESNCAVKWGGGWWFNDCSDAFLNGPYHPNRWLQPWYPPYEDGTDVARTKMMIRRRQ